MARLNEPGAPLESLELLRKRFLRQNKEIIKTNTDQSIKIRTLEAETSRLLSENITLREENIRLSHEVKKGRHALALDNVGLVKDRLQTFAEGLTGLIAELAEAQSTLPDSRPYRDLARRKSPKSPDRQWRGGLNITEILDQEGRLPPIVEGKYYPRKTLDADELSTMSGRNPRFSDSPDLGPPPVIHFDMGDPIKNEQLPSSPSPVKPAKKNTIVEVSDAESQPLSSTLETRKKRRTSTFAGNFELPLVLDHNGNKEDDTVARPNKDKINAKSGGKRKFVMSEEDESFSRLRGWSNNKKTSHESNKMLDLPIRETRTSGASIKDTSVERAAAKCDEERFTKISSSSRRVLGEKPVNTDPMVSPAKTRNGQSDDPKKNYDRPHKREDLSKPTPPTSKHKVTSLRHEDKSEAPEVEAKAHRVIVSTLEVDTSCSPVDIPPPPAVPSVTSVAEPQDTSPIPDSGNRPSRRSRPTISYAEPNLRDKMRRPTKELVDAVGNDERTKRLSSTSDSLPNDLMASALEVSLPNWANKCQGLVGSSESKRNQPTLSEAAFTPTSTNKKSQNLAAKPVGTEKDGKPTSTNLHLASDSKVEQIVGNSNRRLSRARETAAAKLIADADPHSTEQDLFDAIETSSPDANRTVPTRRGRRVSSVPENLNRKASGNGSQRRNGGRRRETMANDANLTERATETEDSQAEASSGSKVERMATRRRSMML